MLTLLDMTVYHIETALRKQTNNETFWRGSGTINNPVHRQVGWAVEHEVIDQMEENLPTSPASPRL